MPSYTGKAKKNVRIDLLPPGRRLASKDCRCCIKRRIRCDRTIPQCQKCHIRGFSCPGFPILHLRWDQGVASRGHLTGKKIPVLREKHQTEKQDSRIFEYLISSETRETLTSAKLNLVNKQLSSSLSEKLLQHFLSNVAFRLTWLDGPSNPWRSLVVPLASRSSCLRLSILGLAAAHLSAIATDHDQSSMMEVNTRIRNQILKVLSQKMRFELHKTPASFDTTPGDSSLIETLASMVVLCYGEMHIPGSSDWKLHLRACRAIIERHDLQRLYRQSQNAVLKFFIKEVVDLETFGNVSVFATDLTTREYMSESPASNDQPWTFTALVNDITVAERSQYDSHGALYTPVLENVDMRYWYVKILSAYDKATSMNTLLATDNKSMATPFHAIIEAHYYACLLYSYQAMMPQARETGELQSIFDSLWQIVGSLAANPSLQFAHDIFFPLFIAGTECQTREQCSQIEALFMQSISVTGFWCNYSVLQFLRLLWNQTDVEGENNWIQFARLNKAKINTFCVF
ncbi:hypothetical protein N7481_008093 [Penicillium waksmanii]|uniref:uncharacterized protein n=1 Tax=Penicillium waksmanii TaxID=69791 RepID=UPI002547D496|nr:uncharacterized protein N7481_008093 [Penicillium waksmanii]KAJ5980795.1 hypothetical protein N7481_008093 [Penicillium waksmanii]